MASGVKVNSTCVDEWNNMKLKHKYAFLTFKIKDDSEIIIDKKGDKGTAYSNFVASLPANDCRYGVVEVPGTTKIVFVLWAPDSSPVKGKMVYASSRQALLDKLAGHTKALQASSYADVEEARMKSSL